MLSTVDKLHCVISYHVNFTPKHDSEEYCKGQLYAHDIDMPFQVLFSFHNSIRSSAQSSDKTMMITMWDQNLERCSAINQLIGRFCDFV